MCLWFIGGITLKELRYATNKGWAVGSEKFIKEVQLACGRAARKRKRSGDRRSIIGINDSDPIDWIAIDSGPIDSSSAKRRKHARPVRPAPTTTQGT